VVRRLHWRAGLLVRCITSGRCIALCALITACCIALQIFEMCTGAPCSECLASCVDDKSESTRVPTFPQVAGPGYSAAHGSQLVLELIPCSSLISPQPLPRHAQRCSKLAWQRSLCLHIQNNSFEIKKQCWRTLAVDASRLCAMPLRNLQQECCVISRKATSWIAHRFTAHLMPITHRPRCRQPPYMYMYDTRASVAAKLAECRKWGTQERCAKADWKSKSSV
jgi:hypothetical protein